MGVKQDPTLRRLFVSDSPLVAEQPYYNKTMLLQVTTKRFAIAVYRLQYRQYFLGRLLSWGLILIHLYTHRVVVVQLPRRILYDTYDDWSTTKIVDGSSTTVVKWFHSEFSNDARALFRRRIISLTAVLFWKQKVPIRYIMSNTSTEAACLIGVFHYAWNRDWNRHTLFHYGLGFGDFQHCGTWHSEIAEFVLRLVRVDFSQNCSERELLDLNNQSRFQSRKSSGDRRSGTGYTEVVVFVPCRFRLIAAFQSRIKSRLQA